MVQSLTLAFEKVIFLTASPMGEDVCGESCRAGEILLSDVL